MIVFTTFITTSMLIAATSHTWEKIEISLTAAKTYPNPYFEVEVWVDLTGPGFNKRCYGFWDGGNSTRAVRETSSLPKGTHGVFPLMWKSVLWNSANETQYAKTFMMTHGAKYQDLIPHKELLSPAWNSTDNWAFCMRTDDKQLFKLYFEKDQKENVSGALPNTKYQAQWFNPRTGEWSNAGLKGILSSDENGIIVLQPAPTSTDDWALSLSTI